MEKAAGGGVAEEEREGLDIDGFYGQVVFKNRSKHEETHPPCFRSQDSPVEAWLGVKLVGEEIEPRLLVIAVPRFSRTPDGNLDKSGKSSGIDWRWHSMACDGGEFC